MVAALGLAQVLGNDLNYELHSFGFSIEATYVVLPRKNDLYKPQKNLQNGSVFCKSTPFLEFIVFSLKESDKSSNYDISGNCKNLFVWGKRNQYKNLLECPFFFSSLAAPYIWA